VNDLQLALEYAVRSWRDLIDGCPYRLADVFFGAFISLAAVLGVMGEWTAAILPLMLAVAALACGQPRGDDR
jgi:hypothetical protein